MENREDKEKTITNMTSPSNSSDDQEFTLTNEMAVDEYEDIDDEEDMEDEDELEQLQKEGDMPIDDLLAIYYNKENESEQTGEDLIMKINEDNIAGVEDGDNNDDPFVNQRVTRGLAALNSHYFDGEYSSDEDYQPTAEDWKKEIQIGEDHQATVDPNICFYKEEENTCEKGDKLLWMPDIISMEKLQNYLSIVYKLTEASHQTPEHDDEQALYTLLQYKSVPVALQKRQEQERQPAEISLWSEEECQNFEQGLRVFGKDFRLIQRNKVKTRSVGEIVQFYYLWKKTERHDAFVAQTKIGRKKYSMPGIADMMGRFMEENDSLYSSRSVSPNIQPCENNSSANNDKENLKHSKDYSKLYESSELLADNATPRLHDNSDLWRTNSFPLASST